MRYNIVIFKNAERTIGLYIFIMAKMNNCSGHFECMFWFNNSMFNLLVANSIPSTSIIQLINTKRESHQVLNVNHRSEYLAINLIINLCDFRFSFSKNNML